MEVHNSLLQHIKVKAGDQVCSSMLGVWLKGRVVQRRGDDIQVQMTSHGPASAAMMGSSWQPRRLRS